MVRSRKFDIVNRCGIARAIAVAMAALALLAGCGRAAAPRVYGLGPVNAEPPVAAASGTPTGTSSAGASPGSNGSGGTGGAGTSAGGTGTGTGGGTPTAAAKPCGLVTGAEASAALGVAGPTTVSLDSDTECLYESGGDGVMIDLEDQPYDPTEVDQLASLPGITRISGIGDAAFQVALDPTETQFHVWIKGKYLAIVLTKASGDTAGPGRTLLDKALARL